MTICFLSSINGLEVKEFLYLKMEELDVFVKPLQEFHYLRLVCWNLKCQWSTENSSLLESMNSRSKSLSMHHKLHYLKVVCQDDI